MQMQSMTQRVGMRELPGVCWDSPKVCEKSQIKVAPRISSLFVLDRRIVLSGAFLFMGGMVYGNERHSV